MILHIPKYLFKRSIIQMLYFSGAPAREACQRSTVGNKSIKPIKFVCHVSVRASGRAGERVNERQPATALSDGRKCSMHQHYLHGYRSWHALIVAVSSESTLTRTVKVERSMYFIKIVAKILLLSISVTPVGFVSYVGQNGIKVQY